MLSIPNQLEGAYLGQDVALVCHTEAYPTSINYWTTERGDMIVSGEYFTSISIRDFLQFDGSTDTHTPPSQELHSDSAVPGAATNMWV
jgi:hypothetical protein